MKSDGFIATCHAEAATGNFLRARPSSPPRAFEKESELFRDHTDSTDAAENPADEPVADALALADVEAIVRLLGATTVSDAPLAEKRRAILEGLARLVDADVWVWVRSRTLPGEHLPAPIELLDGGYVDHAERDRFFVGLLDAEISAAVNPRMLSASHRTIAMDEIMFAHEAALRERWRRLVGMSECIVSVYPVGPQNFSGIGFHRRIGRDAFGPRERGIVHAVVGQLDFLHRDGLDVPANVDALLTLTPRERQVLIYLLGGESTKAIAPRIGLSVHTVNDHIRKIYRRLDVQSRPQLMRLFMSGGSTSRAGAAPGAVAAKS